MKYYTRRGDKGMTDLKVDGKMVRVSKDHPVVLFLGKLDVLNAYIGCCPTIKYPELKDELRVIQGTIYQISGHLGFEANLPDLNPLIKNMEQRCDFYASEAGSINGFIIPDGFYHLARTWCRLVEAESYIDEVNEDISRYLNRLSDYIFAAGRYYNNVILKKEELYASII